MTFYQLNLRFWTKRAENFALCQLILSQLRIDLIWRGRLSTHPSRTTEQKRVTLFWFRCRGGKMKTGFLPLQCIPWIETRPELFLNNFSMFVNRTMIYWEEEWKGWNWSTGKKHYFGQSERRSTHVWRHRQFGPLMALFLRLFLMSGCLEKRKLLPPAW